MQSCTVWILESKNQIHMNCSNTAWVIFTGKTKPIPHTNSFLQTLIDGREEKGACASVGLYFRFELSYSCCLSSLLVFMVCAALNCRVLIHFPVLQILHTCFKERNPLLTKARSTNKWLKVTQGGISQQLLCHCLCWKTGNICALARSKLDFDPRISCPAYHPFKAKQRKGFKSACSFWEAFWSGRVEGLQVRPFKLRLFWMLVEKLFIHKHYFLHLLLKKS